MVELFSYQGEGDELDCCLQDKSRELASANLDTSLLWPTSPGRRADSIFSAGTGE
jgi:hypothetical protein